MKNYPRVLTDLVEHLRHLERHKVLKTAPHADCITRVLTDLVEHLGHLERHKVLKTAPHADWTAFHQVW